MAKYGVWGAKEKMEEKNTRRRSDQRYTEENSGSRNTQTRRRSGSNSAHQNDPEKARRQRTLRAKQRRMQQLRRNIAIGAAAAVAFFLIVGIVVKLTHAGEDKVMEIADANVTTTSVDQTERSMNNTDAQPMESEGIPQEAVQPQEPVATPDPTPEPTPEPTSDPAQAALVNPAQGEVPDRSNFAVDPNIPCGSDHNNGQKIVYLTLDDGPSYLTEQVLDILDQYGVKCTFFVTAQDPEYFYVIKEAYDRGHTIGLHSYTHDYPTIYTSVEGYFQDLDAIAQVVQEQIGYVPCFIRFPGGEANMVSADYCPGIMSQLVNEVNARGYQYYNWHVSSGDGGNIDDVDTLVANATACDYPNIFLLSHDSGGHEATVAALPRIIEYYLSQGYEFRALDRESFACHAEVRN